MGSGEREKGNGKRGVGSGERGELGKGIRWFGMCVIYLELFSSIIIIIIIIITTIN